MALDDLLAHVKARLADGDPALSLYERLRRELEDAIATGGLRRGAAIPGERVLAARLALSRVTVRKAIEGLVADGHLVRRPGAGTAVTGRLEKSLSRLTGFSEEISARGAVPGCVWLARLRTRPSPLEAMALDVPPRGFILRLHRVRTADGVPIAVERAAVPTSVLPDPERIDRSLYAALEAAGFAPVRALQRLRARRATAEDAGHLACAPGAALLVAERRCFDAKGRAVEFTETRYLGDAYDFVAELAR